MGNIGQSVSELRVAKGALASRRSGILMNVLLTGFGPFPGAPFNPTGRLVETLARRPVQAGVRRTAHVFQTSYDTVDHELPLILRRTRPDALIMFGLATLTAHIRIETRARNTLSCNVPDAGGHLPRSSLIARDAIARLPLRTPAQRLLRAARSAGVAARLSDDAGSYLCNYLCWRATKATAKPGGPKLAAFVHVPNVGDHDQAPLTFDELVCAGEAIMRAAVAAVRTTR